MPRVHTITKSPRATKRPYVCTGCREEITAGQRYYKWSKRYGGPRYRHVECGYPRPTELSDRKTAQIEEAVMDADLSSWAPEIPEDWDGDTESLDTSLEGLTDLISMVVESARDVASEYEEGVNNMPDGLQYSPTAEAMNDVAQRLNDWADELEYFEPTTDEPDWPERDRDEDDEDAEWSDEDEAKFREKVAEVYTEWADNARSEAEDKLSDMPEYEG